ncbi:hypothetical protein V8B97DRAFT_1917023 [Scleroderma yunnanense]
MTNTRRLPPDVYYIFSEVNNKPLNICHHPPAVREPVVVSDEQLLFRIQPAGDPSRNTYTIWTEDHRRHLRGIDGHIYASLDRMVVQEWVITYHESRGAWTIASTNGHAWSDPGGPSNCEHKLYLNPLWSPLGPQQTFRIQPLV